MDGILLTHNDGLLLNVCIEGRLKSNTQLMRGWEDERKVVVTKAQTYAWTIRLIGINLADYIEARQAVQVRPIHEQDYDALSAHPQTENIRVVVELLKLLHLLIVPHDYFSRWPFRVGAPADEGHYVFSVE